MRDFFRASEYGIVVDHQHSLLLSFVAPEEVTKTVVHLLI